MRKFNAENVKEVMDLVISKGFSVDDLRELKDEFNKIIKENSEEAKAAAKVNKELADEENTVKATEYLKGVIAGELIEIKMADGTIETIRAKNINMAKGTVSGERLHLDADGKYSEVLTKDGKKATLWKYFKDVVIPVTGEETVEEIEE